MITLPRVLVETHELNNAGLLKFCLKRALECHIVCPLVAHSKCCYRSILKPESRFFAQKFPTVRGRFV